MKSHRTMFLRTANGSPCGCVAITLLKGSEKDRSTVYYQTSTLNPIDKFDREMARAICLGRMVEKPMTVAVSAKPTMYEVTLAVMKGVARDKHQPTRTRQAAQRWLDNNEKRYFEVELPSLSSSIKKFVDRRATTSAK